MCCEDNNNLLAAAGADAAGGGVGARSDDASSSSPSGIDLPTPTDSSKTKPVVTIDTSNLDEHDLERLKEEDPFLYYSIPAVWHVDIAHSGHVDTRATSGSLNRRASCPDRIESSHHSKTTKVERKSRISFECHTDVLMEDMLGDIDDLFLKKFGDLDLDFDFDSMLQRLQLDVAKSSRTAA